MLVLVPDILQMDVNGAKQILVGDAMELEHKWKGACVDFDGGRVAVLEGEGV